MFIELVKQNANLPNCLTSSRLVLSPVLAVLFLYDEAIPGARYWVMVIVILSELSDLFDGYMARKHGQVTDFGKILDPMADSMYRDTIFLSLAVIDQVSLFLVLPILYRDSIISTLRTVCAYKGIVLAARKSGKMKAIVQAVIILIILLLRIIALHVTTIESWIYVIANSLMGIACIITLYSAYDYLSSLIPIILKMDTNRVEQE